MLREIVSLFYPSLCAACSEPLLRNERIICAACFMDLPYTDYHREKNNPVERLFWGRSRVHFATSLCHFRKAGRVQKLLHQLKYKGNTSVGQFLGVELGKQISHSPHFGKIDLVLPVPLHPKKERIRGYNQSLFIAEGISGIIDAPVQTDLLLRERNNASQTRRSRYDRYQNTETIFRLREPGAVYRKHILIVDDVVTTGATLEACCNTIVCEEETKVSVATIAVA